HAEDGIRDFHVTGVQTCALPISSPSNQAAAAGISVAVVGIDAVGAGLAGLAAAAGAALLPFTCRVRAGSTAYSSRSSSVFHQGIDRKSVVEGKRVARGGGGVRGQ